MEDLERSGDLLRIEAEVNPCLEAAEIARRANAKGGPALLMGCVKGHDLPIAVNLLATDDRICRALGVDRLDEIVERIEQIVDPSEPEGWFERLKTAPTRSLLGKLPPRSVKTGAVQQAVRLGGDVDLARLPFLQSWPNEPGRAIMAGMFCSRGADGGRELVAAYPLEILDRDRMAVRWDAHDEAERILKQCRNRGRAMSVAVVLGGDPVCMLAARAWAVGSTDVWAFAGLLREKSLDVVACRSVDLHVPADAEIVIEGTINPDEPAIQSGPWCMADGYYRPVCSGRVVHVTAVTQRANAVCPVIVHGPLEGGAVAAEAVVIFRAMAKIQLPLLRQTVDEIVDFNMPACGGGRHIAVVSIRKSYAGQACRVAHAIWGVPGLMFSKVLILVDEDVDIHNWNEVWAAVASKVEPRRDVFFSEAPPNLDDPAIFVDRLDEMTSSSKMGIDATSKMPGESAKQAELARMTEDVIQAVSRRWVELGLGHLD
ncbi:MAG: UbiD family decarboxylase [Pirellulales bacterium]|nr:UbiD family decarboxylase [Pirellulales bacterium]